MLPTSPMIDNRRRTGRRTYGVAQLDQTGSGKRVGRISRTWRDESLREVLAALAMFLVGILLSMESVIASGVPIGKVVAVGDLVRISPDDRCDSSDVRQNGRVDWEFAGGQQCV
jgi:hypothetical protein